MEMTSIVRKVIVSGAGFLTAVGLSVIAVALGSRVELLDRALVAAAMEGLGPFEDLTAVWVLAASVLSVGLSIVVALAARVIRLPAVTWVGIAGCSLSITMLGCCMVAARDIREQVCFGLSRPYVEAGLLGVLLPTSIVVFALTVSCSGLMLRRWGSGEGTVVPRQRPN